MSIDNKEAATKPPATVENCPHYQRMQSLEEFPQKTSNNTTKLTPPSQAAYSGNHKEHHHHETKYQSRSHDIIVKEDPNIGIILRIRCVKRIEINSPIGRNCQI